MKLFIFILLTFSALNPALVYSSCEEVFSSLTPVQKKAQKSVEEALVPLTPVQEKAQKSVWIVKSLDSSGAALEIVFGIGFFIGPSTFVTPFFAGSEAVNWNGIDGITLTQKGNSRTLRIKRIMHLSVPYNLAVLEIEEKVKDYAKLKQGVPSSQENLSITIGYSNGNVQVIKTTGDIFDNSVFNRTIDPGNHFNNSRTSGSPVLNTDGEVVGVYHAQNGNVLRAVKIIHLQNLIEQKVKVFKSPKGHLEHSIKEAIEAAEQGDASAQNNLGDIYKNGYDIKQDYLEHSIKEAIETAEQGDASAQNNLGDIYKNGYNIKQDYEEAFKWWKKAAEQGYIPAQYSLALSYYLEDGVKQDYQKAFDWFEKVAEQGRADAQYYLGYFFYRGLGVPKDYKEALNWFRKAAEQGHAPAQYYLGYFFHLGLGVPKNYKEAFKWYTKSAEQGHADAQFNLGYLRMKD